MPAFQDNFMFFAVLMLAGLLPAIFLIQTATKPEEREATNLRRRERQAGQHGNQPPEAVGIS